jgi:voltage-gated potassium channel
MGFAHQAIAATLLVSATLWFQCGGMAVLIHWARTSIERGTKRLSPWHSSVLMIQFTVVIISLHILEVLLWAAFYRWRCLPSWEAGFYFSAASYSTVGYGDVVLPRVWRSLGPVESITGMLMCGLSVSGLFAILARLVASEDHSSEALPEGYSGSAVPQRPRGGRNAVY